MLSKSSPIDIEAIYEQYIDEKQEENFESVEQIESTNPIDSRTKRLLKLGNIVHDDIQNSLTHTRYNKVLNNNVLNTEKEINNKEKDIDFHVEGTLTIPELKVRGHYDIIVDDKTQERKVYLYDIKTCGGYAWKMKFGRNKKLDVSVHYELQLGTYGYAVKEEFGQLDGMYLYYYNKDTSAMRCVEVPLTFVSRAYLFWRNLNDEHKMGLPGFREGVSPVQKWQCNYCQFKNHCNPPT